MKEILTKAYLSQLDEDVVVFSIDPGVLYEIYQGYLENFKLKFGKAKGRIVFTHHNEIPKGLSTKAIVYNYNLKDK